MQISWIDILLILLVLPLGGVCFMLFRRLQQQERRHQALINVLRNEIQAMTNSSIGMGRRLIEVEQKLNLTADKQLELENRDPGVLAYNQAARLMEMGADVDDLVQSCGIGRPEAELMALLHKELEAPQHSIGQER
ncbi:DUF2802 domain-containing protein [Neptuniibacter caesariensis]|uniref:DUF2802 domain-containing protein n=1 Tax=Neptuniibacter caesariensis TaxID=207954 RepID=A0A7U8GRS5_NEPCE|nr:DUF2802 domain-containing protein [Neptuniibacter caesariensis]EAR60553.1 hypothetical protein MED92_16855 [Oceanospirillum sp. MED92] [Neptuniibacter caesariensis]